MISLVMQKWSDNIDESTKKNIKEVLNFNLKDQSIKELKELASKFSLKG